MKINRWLYLIVSCMAFVLVGYVLVLSVINNDIFKVTFYGFGWTFSLWFIFDAIEILQSNYKYLVIYVFESKDVKNGSGRVFINIDTPIKTQSDIEKVEEYIKLEYDYQKAFITNYIKLKHDKK